MQLAEDSRHKCLIYEGHPSEQLPIIVPLIQDGLAEGRRCLYLGDPETVRMVRDAAETKGVDVERQVARGALVFSSDRSHLAGGGFDPKGMVALLRGLVDAAVKDGFTGLCATGDMRWELGTDANFERLQEYEALLEQVFRDLPLMGICQYHRDTVPAQALQDALTTHRSVWVGSSLRRDNVFYIPPEILLKEGADRERLGDWVYQQIRRVMKAEEQRDKTLAELEKTNRDLELRVKQRTADLEAFSYSVSHDLRAPLRAINGFTEIIEKEHAGALSDDGKAAFARVRNASGRMSRLIDGLLELFRLTSHELSVAPVDLSREARTIVEDLRAADPGRCVEVQIVDGAAAQGDAPLLIAVLTNLLGNAWKFTAGRPDARIEFGMQESPEGRVFYVRDNGAGFDMAYQDKLFKVFQRLHTETEFPGTGIGLATAKRIVSRHGGRIWAEASPGKGATFYFTVASPER
ncbi:MAG: MEDS domain-containing protein [Elusimicrobia bacterium]|nr:MEDS domain-containing protein [Elusimicrobiota bacterium]